MLVNRISPYKKYSKIFLKLKERDIELEISKVPGGRKNNLFS